MNIIIVSEVTTEECERAQEEYARAQAELDARCKYGGMRGGVCIFGYPGCACMDDLMAATDPNELDDF